MAILIFNVYWQRNITVKLKNESQYKDLLTKAKALVSDDVDDVANMANVSRLIMEHLPNHWIGFYRVVGQDLLLGPFNGPIACTRIGFGKGVCGKAWETRQTQLVDDVHQFPGHIACSALSNSEIVIPCIRDGEVFAVLDIDSTEYAKFTALDKKHLEELVSYL
jgi:GAF domain-containing protein